jgi:hypothetical protein
LARIEWVGQSARDADNRQANTSRLINFYREPVGGTAGYQLKSVLGTQDLVTLTPSSGPTLNVRAISEISGKMYVVSGGWLFTVTAAGVATEIGFTRDREPTYLFGAEQIAVGQNNVCVVVGGRYYVYDGTTIERPDPVDAPFENFGSGIYLNGFVVLTEQNGSRFLWTDLADAKNFEGLNFATAESTDKPIIEAKKVNGRLWLMKSDVIEVWSQVGSGANAFQRVTGGVIEVGLKAESLATTFTGGIFFVGSDDIVYLSSGEELSPISPPPVNTAVANGEPTKVLYYEDEGHKFCVIRFSDRPAWVYDIVTGEWHERATGVDGPWAVTATGTFNQKWYAGNTRGELSLMTRNNVDGDESLIRTAVSNTLYMDGNFFSVPRFEVTGRVGIGASEETEEVTLTHCLDGRVFEPQDVPDPAPAGSVERTVIRYKRGPQIGLELSGDGGRTFGEQITRSFGTLGEYEQICRFPPLGGHYRLCAKITLSEERDISLDAMANVEVA